MKRYGILFIKAAISIALIMLLSDQLLKLWYSSMLDMYLYNLYSKIFNHGITTSQPEFVMELTAITEFIVSLLISTIIVLGMRRLWRRKWLRASASKV